MGENISNKELISDKSTAKKKKKKKNQQTLKLGKRPKCLISQNKTYK